MLISAYKPQASTVSIFFTIALFAALYCTAGCTSLPACPTGKKLSGGQCVAETAAGGSSQTPTAKVCAIATDCAAKANTTATCGADGTCMYACNANYGDCNSDLSQSGGDGCEVTVNTTDHCGACAATCSATQYCAGANDGCHDVKATWATLVPYYSAVREEITDFATDAQSNIYIARNKLNVSGNVLVSYDGGSAIVSKWSPGSSVSAWSNAYGTVPNMVYTNAVINLPTSKTFLLGGFGRGVNDFGGTILTDSVGPTEMFMVSIDQLTNSQKAYQFGSPTADEVPTYATSDNQSAIFVAGFFSSGVSQLSSDSATLPFNGGQDVFTAKFDAQAVPPKVLWSHSFGSPAFDYPTGTVWGDSGKLFTVGVFGSTINFDSQLSLTPRVPMQSDGFVVAQSADNGSTLWAKYAGPSVPWNPSTLTLTSKALLVGGIGNAKQPQLVAYNPADGSLLWNVPLDGTGNAIALTSDATGDAYVAVSYYGSLGWSGHTIASSNGGLDIAVIRFDPKTRDIKWARSFGSTNDEDVIKIATDAQNRISLIGKLHGKVDFGTGMIGDDDATRERQLILQITQ